MDQESINTIPQQNAVEKPMITNTSPVSSSKRIYRWLLLVFIIIVAGSGMWFFYNKFFIPKKQSMSTNNTHIGANGVLRIGETTDEDGVAADTKEFQPFITYLVSKLKSQGITKGEFVSAKSITEMTELVREGKLDVVIDSAFPVYVVDQLTGSQPIADRWKTGVGTYHAAIFVKKDSPIQSINDLKGKILAVDSLTSTISYFVPKAELLREGYTLTQKNNPTDPVASNEIGYTFVHNSVYESVASGTTPAGAESEIEIDNYFGDKINNYRIIFKSPDILRFLVATRGDLNPKLRDAIKTVLFNMDKTQEGRSVLSNFSDTAKFTPVTSTDEAYGEIKNLANFVEQELITQ